MMTSVEGISDDEAPHGRKEFGMAGRHSNRTGRLSLEKKLATQLMVARSIPVQPTVLATSIADSRRRDAGKNRAESVAPSRELARTTSAPVNLRRAEEQLDNLILSAASPIDDQPEQHQ
jgi:hypothetical protein